LAHDQNPAALVGARVASSASVRTEKRAIDRRILVGDDWRCVGHFGALGTVSVLLPQVLAGLASIFVLYALVRRRFGTSAGLLAALFLALNPISVAVDRSNSTESWLVLTLLLAAGTLSRTVETGRVRFLLLAAAAKLGSEKADRAISDS
jgi:predicted membrane-bound mannosyltransferase